MSNELSGRVASGNLPLSHDQGSDKRMMMKPGVWLWLHLQCKPIRLLGDLFLEHSGIHFYLDQIYIGLNAIMVLSLGLEMPAA